MFAVTTLNSPCFSTVGSSFYPVLVFLGIISPMHPSSFLDPPVCWKEIRLNVSSYPILRVFFTGFFILFYSWILFNSAASSLLIHTAFPYSFSSLRLRPTVVPKVTLVPYPNANTKTAFLSFRHALPLLETNFLIGKRTSSKYCCYRKEIKQTTLNANPFKKVVPLTSSRQQTLRLARSSVGSTFFWKRLIPVGVFFSGVFSTYYMTLAWILRRQAALTKEFNARMLLRLCYEAESHSVYEFYKRRIPFFRFYKRQLFAHFSHYFLETLEKWNIKILQNFGKLAFEDFKLKELEVASMLRYAIETSRNEQRLRRVFLLSECLFSNAYVKSYLKPPWIIALFNGTQNLETLLLKTRENFYKEELEKYFSDPLMEEHNDFDKQYLFWTNAHKQPLLPGWEFLRFTYNDSLRLTREFIDGKIAILKMKKEKGFFDSAYEHDTQYAAEETKFLKRYSEGLENQQIFSENRKGLFYPHLHDDAISESLPINKTTNEELEAEDFTFHDLKKFKKDEEFRTKAIKASEESWNTFMDFILLSEEMNKKISLDEKNSPFSMYTLDEERIGLPEYHAECVRNNTLRILQEMEFRKWCRENNLAVEVKNGNLEVIPSGEKYINKTENRTSTETLLADALESGYTLRIESPHSMQSLLETYKDESVPTTDQDARFAESTFKGSLSPSKSSQFECSGCGYSVFLQASQSSALQDGMAGSHPFSSDFFVCPCCGAPKSHFHSIETLVKSGN